ncbi:MAG: glycoside hydrolase family 127 protein [Armatimonadetes bacterium]|nr:glycoside hydrolase family 127 protein [Armatimonadota bacterium]
MKRQSRFSLLIPAVLAAMSMLACSCAGESRPEPKRSTAIKYINMEVPKIVLPEYKGKRYEAQVPDTLDMADRAALGINGLVGVTDPDADYEIYWIAAFQCNPPHMVHDFNDHVQIKFMEALPLMRVVSGSREREEVDLRWMETIMQMQGPNGLLYQPVVGRPWTRLGVYGDIPKDAEQFTEPYFNGRLLGAIAIYYELTGDERWKEVGKRIVDGLAAVVVDKGEYAYYTKAVYVMNEVSDPNTVPDKWTTMMSGWIVQGLAQFYKATGYKPALTLSGKLARHIRFIGGIFDAEGRFTDIVMHFHGHLYPLLGMLEYAAAAGDWDMIQFTRKGFEYGIVNMHSSTVGFSPEVIDPEACSEICGVADMIALGLKLSLAGAGDYWDDVDRWTRNQFAEGQLMSADWVPKMIKDLPLRTDLPPYACADNVAERCVGGFAGWPTANDWHGREGGAIMQCCTGNGTRAIYYVWENILAYDKGKLKVNLLLNRASPWADVESYVPYQGRVDVRVKTRCDLSIRIPEWVQAKDVSCKVNGKDHPLSWNGRYAIVGKSRPGNVVTLRFPIFERTTTVHIQKKDYRLILKGNDVVHIDPEGKNCPLYQREHYRSSTPRMRKAQRFVADNLIQW